MRKFLKKIYVVAFLLGALGIQQVQAQQDSQYTQYMYNTMSFNPAYAGSRGSFSMIGLYRNQWVGLEGAPETLNFSAHSPIGIQGVGVGLGFTSDRIGPSVENTIVADFSYTLPMNDKGTKLAFGVAAGINMLDIDVNKLTIYNPNDVNLTSQQVSSPVVGVGFFLYDENWYAGLSTPNLLETEHYNDIAVSTATEKMHVYLVGGYIFELNPNLKFKPAVLAKAVSGAPLAVDISANFLFSEKFTLGAGYRLDAGISALVGFQISDQLMIGYAYDYGLTELSNYHDGSHELFLRFELGTRVSNKVNPRFF